ncbi:MAG: NAD(+) diphosphatase [Kordiimonadaceae bacterium]|nr:NAD(+) diphosphatase [Kordiimonadaceae bacterium]
MALADITTSFSGNPLDRADHLRGDNEIFGTYLERDDTRVVLMAGEQILSQKDGTLVWLNYESCKILPQINLIFLGLEEGAPRYALHLYGAETDFEGSLTYKEKGIKFRDGRTLGFKLGDAHPSLGIVAQAKSMLLWHQNHMFCAVCNAESRLVKAGYERLCDTCGTSHFPRTDPVVIMLALHGDKALVGRGVGWPEGNFSALAGFVEPGESMEEAVARELHEEVGLTAIKVKYVASQPWPRPSSLMIGAMAWVEDTALTIDAGEIAEAIWITKEEVRASLRGDHEKRLIPPSYAIAHNLIKAWLDEE